jgi:hypothetical protein
MSANIQSIDVQVGTETAWHKMTHVKPVINRGNCEIIYPMHKEPLQTVSGIATGFFGIVCDDVNAVVGSPVGADYTLIDHDMIWDMVDKALAGTSHTIVSCGTVGSRSRGFISVKLSANFVAAGRDTEDVLNIIWGHGGKCAVIGRTGITVIVCQNTLSLALARRGNFNFNVRHTGNAIHKLDGMSEAIDAHCGVVAEFKQTMEQFTKQSCNPTEARQIFAGFLVREDKPEEVSTRASNQIDEFVSLYQRGKGNTGKDFADVFNATSDYYTHSSSGGENRWKQVESSEFGMGNRRKTEMFNLLNGADVPDLGNLATVRSRGDKVLQLV